MIALQDSLRTNLAPSFGGLWVSDGKLFVAVVDGDSRVRGAVANARLSIVPTFVSVDYAEAAINEAADELYAELRSADFRTLDGLQFAALNPDVKDSNRVVLEVVQATPAQLAKLQARLDPVVVVKSVEAAPVATACTSLSNCGSPMKAGLFLFHGVDNYVANAAFAVRSGSSYYLLSAGHTNTVIGEGRNHPDTALNFGTVFKTSTSGKVDAALITLSQANASNLLMDSNTGTSWWSVVSRQATSQEYIGMSVCDDTQTGNHCGYLANTNYSLSWVTNQRRATGLRPFGGDSGMPVWTPLQTSPFTVQAAGVLVASIPGTNDGVYTHSTNIEALWGVSTVVTMP